MDLRSTQFASFKEYEEEFDSQWQQNTVKAAELVEGFMRIGYLLKLARDTDILSGTEYTDYIEFARKKYDIGQDVVSRYININSAFSVGGNSMVLEERYKGFGYAKLALMLTLPEDIREELTPEYSKSEIQAIKEEVAAEEKITDIEVMLEGQKPEQYEMDGMEKVFHQMFGDEPELYRLLSGRYKEAADRSRAAYETLAPSGEKMYSIRIAGIGRIFAFVKKEGINLDYVRTGEKESYGWEKVDIALSMFMDTEKNPKAAWEELYGKPFPEENREVAPVQQPKQMPRKESRVQKATKPETEKKPPAKKEEPQQEEKNVREDSAEDKAVPMGNEDAAHGAEEKGRDLLSAEQDEQHSTLPVQRQRQWEALRQRKQEAAADISKYMQELAESIGSEKWETAKMAIANIRADIERIEKAEAELADLRDTSQMRIEDYGQEEEQ